MGIQAAGLAATLALVGLAPTALATTAIPAAAARPATVSPNATAAGATVSVGSTTTAVAANAVGSVTLTKPTGTTAGDVLVASFTADQNPTATAPAGWVTLTAPQTIGSGARSFTYYRVVTANDSATTSWSWPLSSAEKWGGGITRYLHVDPTTPLDTGVVTAVDTSWTATSLTTASLTTKTPGALVIGGIGSDSRTPGAGAPSGWTSAWVSTGGQMAAQASRSTSQPGSTGSAAWTVSVARAMGAWTTALRPATTATPTPTPTPSTSPTSTPTSTPTTSPTSTPTTSPTSTPTTSPTGPAAGRVTKLLTIVEENHGLAQAQAGMPYLNSLAQRFSYATHYTAITHPSLPNYLAIAGGDFFGITDDNDPSAHVLHGSTVFGQALAAGDTAKSYDESMPANCTVTGNTDFGYAVKHNPWAYFADERTSCQSDDVSTSGLAADITADRLPTVGMLTPNKGDDAHDGTLAQADTYLQSVVPSILASADFTSGRLAVVITSDEDSNTGGNNGVLTVVLQAGLDGTHTVVSTALTHYSLSRLYSQVVGATPLRNAASAPDMAAAFGLSVGGSRPTSSPTASSTPTATSSPTATPTPTASPTATPTPTASPTATPTPTGPTDPSGQQMPTTSTTSGFAYSYGQDFNTSAALGQFANVYGTNWAGYNGTNDDTSRVGSYQPGKVLSVANSMLDMYIHYDPTTGLYDGAAPFPQPPAGVNGGSQEYLGMRTSIRFKATGSMAHYGTAWLLWPSSWNWSDGEIDGPENSLAFGSAGYMTGANHQANGDPSQYVKVTTASDFSSWHTWTVQWIPSDAAGNGGSVEQFLDGVSILKTTTHVPNKPMHWTLQTATRGDGTPSQSASGHISIDWLTVSRYTG